MTLGFTEKHAAVLVGLALWATCSWGAQWLYDRPAAPPLPDPTSPSLAVLAQQRAVADAQADRDARAWVEAWTTHQAEDDTRAAAVAAAVQRVDTQWDADLAAMNLAIEQANIAQIARDTATLTEQRGRR